MKRIVCFLQLLGTIWTYPTYPLYNPYEHIYPLAYPYTGQPGGNYGYTTNYQSGYSSYQNIPYYMDKFVQNHIPGYSAVPDEASSLNFLAELPFSMSKEFSVVPMFIVSKNAMNMVSQGHIVSASDQQPLLTVKLNPNSSISCTPAVRMVLEKPIIVGSLRSNVLFPSEVQILHDGVRIPIRIGAVIAPVLPNTYVSQDAPISVRVVYAIPTKPIRITITITQDNDESTTEKPVVIEERFPEISDLPSQKPGPVNTVTDSRPGDLPKPENQTEKNPDTSPGSGFGALATNPDYINNSDAVFISNQEAVVVEGETDLPPKNVTVIDFPEKEAEPVLQVDEEDEELVNRNPPLFLAPAGIVQSTQPGAHVETFHNDKESPFLDTLREQSNRKRI